MISDNDLGYDLGKKRKRYVMLSTKLYGTINISIRTIFVS